MDYITLILVVDRQQHMSRRTRLKQIRSRERFTLAHHSQYAATTTHFPRAYSILGEDITFPISVLPFFSVNKITYSGKSDAFFNTLNENPFDEKQLKLVSISIEGQKYKSGSSITNLILFACSMICFCLNWCFKLNAYRSITYPKYRFDDYDTLVKIVERFKNVETLIINFQDNDIDKQKMERMDDSFSRTSIKTVVFRNLTYFIAVDNVNSYFKKARSKQKMQFKFIWQKFSLGSVSSGTEQECSLMDLCDQL